MNLGLVIEAYRHDRRLGQREMAKAIGISNTILSRIERGAICDSVSLTKILVWLLDGETAKLPAHSRAAKRELSNSASIGRLEMRQ